MSEQLWLELEPKCHMCEMPLGPAWVNVDGALWCCTSCPYCRCREDAGLEPEVIALRYRERAAQRRSA